MTRDDLKVYCRVRRNLNERRGTPSQWHAGRAATAHGDPRSAAGLLGSLSGLQVRTRSQAQARRMCRGHIMVCPAYISHGNHTVSVS